MVMVGCHPPFLSTPTFLDTCLLVDAKINLILPPIGVLDFVFKVVEAHGILSEDKVYLPALPFGRAGSFLAQ